MSTQIKNAVIDYRFDGSTNPPLDIYGHAVNSAEQINQIFS